MNVPVQKLRQRMRRGGKIAVGSVIMALYMEMRQTKLYVGVLAANKRVVWTQPAGGDYESTMFYTKWTERPHGEDSVDVPTKNMFAIVGATHNPERDLVRLPDPLKKIVQRLVGEHATNAAVSAGISYTKSHDPYKIRVNEVLAKMADSALERCGAHNPAALFLDSSDAITAKTLCRLTKFGASDMFSPNDDRGVCEEIKRKIPGIYAPTETIENMLDTFSGRMFAFSWIDGCSTWLGSRGRSTAIAVKKLIKRRILTNNAVVAYTVSVRGYAGKRCATAGKEMARNQGQVKRWAHVSGYTVSTPRLLHVTRSTYTVVFQVYSMSLPKIDTIVDGKTIL